MTLPSPTVEELVSGRAWTTSFFDVRQFLTPADSLEDALIRMLWYQYVSTFSPPASLLSVRIGTLAQSAESYIREKTLPENVIRAWQTAVGFSSYTPKSQIVRAFKTLLARTGGSDLVKLLIAHRLFSEADGLESTIGNDLPILRIYPCGSLGITSFSIAPNTLSFSSTSDQTAFTTAPKSVKWMYRALNGLAEKTTCDDALRALSLVAVPMNPASFVQVPAPANVIALLVNAADAYTDPNTSRDVRALVVQSLSSFRSQSQDATLSIRALLSWMSRLTFAGQTSSYDSPIVSAAYDVVRGYGSAALPQVCQTLTSVEALGSRLDMPFTMSDIDGGEDDSDAAPSAKKKTSSTPDASASDDITDDGTDPNEQDDGSGGVAPSDDTASGDDSGDAPGGNLFNNSNSIGEDVSKNNNDIDLLKGGSDQAVIRETLYRCAVASLNDSLAQRTDLSIPRDTRTQLSDWCKFFLFTVKPEQTKRFLKKLGLDKVLEPITL